MNAKNLGSPNKILSKIGKDIKVKIKRITNKNFNPFRLSILLLVLAIVSFFLIIIFSKNLHFDLSYKGFNDFQEIFLFPIRLIIGSITLFGLHVTLKKYNQDKENNKNQLKQNWDIFITSNQPFLTISKILKHFPESDNKYTISMEIKNTGKFPALISSIILIIYNNKENKYIFDKIKFLIFPTETKTISPTFTNFNNSIFNNINIIAEIILNYNGIDKRSNQTKISYSYDKSNNKFKEQNCLWDYKINNN